MADHYFSAHPTSTPHPRVVDVSLGGRQVHVTTSAGVFSPERLDPGTSVLLAEAPAPTGGGTLLDIGCGWGPIALHLALCDPTATVYAVDVNDRARELTRRNAASVSATGVITAAPDEVPDTVNFDEIWSNPPIHIGKDALHDILLRWLPRLVVGGHAWLVVQKHLGSDSLARWLSQSLPDDFTVERAASKKAFRVLHVSRADDRPRADISHPA
ncbi:MAG TPA: methyltransferase [Pseudoclavibacter sp.]|nr:methyltransferase [Pseudoclavibacter sp.]